MPRYLFKHMLSFAALEDLANMALANKECYKEVQEVLNKKIKYLAKKNILGPEQWNVYFGQVEKSKPPKQLREFMRSDCPYTKGRKVFQTHRIIYIPSKINNKALTHIRIADLIINEGLVREWMVNNVGQSHHNENPYWMAIKKTPIEVLDSPPKNYAIASILETLVYCGMECVCFPKKDHYVVSWLVEDTSDRHYFHFSFLLKDRLFLVERLFSEVVNYGIVRRFY